MRLLFHGKQQNAVHFGNENYVDKYTRHVNISTVSFFHSYQKIKIAFNSYIYKYSDSSLYRFEESENTKSFNNWTSDLFCQCLPSTCTFQDLSAMWSCSEMMAERKHYGGWGSPGWRFVFQPALGGLTKPSLLMLCFKAVWISLKCPYLEVLNYEVFLFGKNIIIESAAGVASSMV